MGLFSFFRKKDVEEEIRRDNTPDHTEEVTSAMDLLCEKCDYGDHMERLSPAERVFYIAQLVEEEVNNGGFDQCFTNASGAFSAEFVGAFYEISAPITAAICRRALDAVGGSLPADQDELIDRLEDDDCCDALEECDNDFYAYEEDLTELCYQYMIANSIEWN